MAESSTVTALRTKRDELERIISSYEKATTAARRDLAHFSATLELLERDGTQAAYPSRMSIVRMFKRGELFALCNAALAEAIGGLDTRELALVVIRARGMDEADSVLRKAIGFRIVQAMLRQRMRGFVTGAVKRKGVRVWRLSGIA
ncbi:MAG: hypothetical protein WBE80_16630 [Methylocella sp.]